MLVQSLPGTGKTQAIAMLGDGWLDGDDIAASGNTQASIIAINPKISIIDSRWFVDSALQPDMVVIPVLSWWLDNIRRNRSDLIDQFGVDTLRKWHQDYIDTFVLDINGSLGQIYSCTEIVLLKPGYYVSDILRPYVQFSEVLDFFK